MTTPSRAAQSDTTLTRDLLYAARFYFGRPRTWIVVAIITVAMGLVFNWSWLVAAGLAPILLSTLPCLVMCAIGVCTMCRSAKEQSASAPDSNSALASPPMAADRLTPATNAVGSVPAIAQSTAVAPPEVNELPAGSSCCQSLDETNFIQSTNPQPNDERKVSNA